MAHRNAFCKKLYPKNCFVVGLRHCQQRIHNFRILFICSITVHIFIEDHLLDFRRIGEIIQQTGINLDLPVNTFPARKAEEERKAAEEAARKAEEERLAKRQEIVDFALQFVGNPYVYGGTSLTNGADCSGFVMSVFAQFGYELPRVAAAQCAASEKKDVADIEVGDLVFYGDGGIDHVALYIGDGKIVHASTAATGIKVSDYNYRAPAAVGTFVEKRISDR